MRCHSVQALWAPTPPHHDVLSMVACANPPSLWTGGSRGDIILWKLPSGPPSNASSSEQELWPMAILCGHTAAITALEVCTPGKLYEAKANQRSKGNVVSSSGPSDGASFSNVSQAVLSACIEGWLCVWDSLTGRCRRRRRLPPWAGSPCMMATLRSSQRYVCIAGNGAHAGLSAGNMFLNDGNNEVQVVGDHGTRKALERMGSMKKNVRGAVVIVDSLTLSVSQVVHNGSLGIGPMKCMVILTESESVHLVMASDPCGRTKSWSIDQVKQGKQAAGAWKQEQTPPASPKASTTPHKDAQSVSLSADGKHALLVFPFYWAITSTDDYSKDVHMEKRQSGNDSECLWAGGFFLIGSNQQTEGFDTHCRAAEKRSKFVVWDMNGGATVYCLHKTDKSFDVQVVCQIPAIAPHCEKKYHIKFCQMLDSLICVGSGRLNIEAMSTPETWVRLWCLPANLFFNLEFQFSRALLNGCHMETGLMMPNSNCSLGNLEKAICCGQGGLQNHWSRVFTNNPAKFLTMEKAHVEVTNCEMDSDNASKITVQDAHVLGGGLSGLMPVTFNSILDDMKGLTELNNSTWVTASMLLSGRSSFPSTVVFGYNTGDIRLVELEAKGELTLDHKNDSSVDDQAGRHSLQCLRRHTGPITCLAEHAVPVQTSEENSGEGSRRVLISGSKDCLTCIWHLKMGGELLVVLHHHVAPLCQILLPPLGTNLPWSNCFITAGEDGCVALTSLETLQVERMFPGHPASPRMIAWDGTRGYISCLCAGLQVSSSDALYIWDLKSGALERTLRGPAAHSMFANFLKQSQGGLVANGLLPGRATSISSLLHGDEDSPHSHSNHGSLPNRSPGLGTKADTVGTTGLGSLQGPYGHAVVKDDAHPEDLTLSTVETASKKVIGSIEKFSSRVTQAFNQGTKSGPSDQQGFITRLNTGKTTAFNLSSSNRDLFHKQQPIKGACPFPGVGALQFDLFALMAPDLGRLGRSERNNVQSRTTSVSSEQKKESSNTKGTLHVEGNLDGQMANGRQDGTQELTSLHGKGGVLASNSGQPQIAWSLGTFEGCLLRMSLSFLHFWGADSELDTLLEKELRIVQPSCLGVAAGLAGDRGAMTLLLPGWRPTLELWTISSEFCALRLLTIVAVAQRMITLSRPTSNASSALAAFYTRFLTEKFPNVKAPSLELYAYFLHDPSEHVRMAARCLFHSAASRAIPPLLSLENSLISSFSEQYWSNFESQSSVDQNMNGCSVEKRVWPESFHSSVDIHEWLESFEGQDWTSIVGGTSQDARAARIIVAAALAVWYPRLVRPDLAPTVAPFLVKLVKAVIDRHSATAAELLADGMEDIWQHLISIEVSQLVSDVFLLIDCLSGGASANPRVSHNPVIAMSIREALTGNLLPSLAMADLPAFLRILQNQLLAASSDAPIHLVSLKAIVSTIRGAPRTVAPFLGQITSIILRTMDSGKHCFQSAMATLREMVRVFPMVALHQGCGKLAIGDSVGDVHSLSIQVYDINSVTKLRVLDASGPPGHPALLFKDGASTCIGGISALSFSEDGEGLVAFSLNGLMIRWWSLGAAWWEKLSRPSIPVQCTKLVLVPPWAGFSPKSSQSSIMATISNPHNMKESREEQEKVHRNVDDIGKIPAHNVDLSYKLEWRQGKKVALLHHGQEVGIFQL